MGLIETQESDIITKLAAYLGSTVDVKLLPEKQADYSDVLLKPIVYVCYHETNYQERKSTSTVVQNTTETFNIIVRAKKLRGTIGVWDLKQKIQEALMGFSPASCGGIYLKVFTPEEYDTDRNEWSFKLQANCDSMVVAIDSDPTGVPITAITVTPVLG